MKRFPVSPCIDVCKIDSATGYCQGCFRTLDEIATWQQMADEEKEWVYGELDKRKSSNYKSERKANQ